MAALAQVDLSRGAVDFAKTFPEANTFEAIAHRPTLVDADEHKVVALATLNNS